MRTVLQTRIARALNHQRPSPERQREHSFTVTLFLDGITPDDYMQWIRDPEPPNRDDLRLITATTTGLRDTIQLELLSTGEPPPAAVAASAVGFPITPEVIELCSGPSTPNASAGCRVKYRAGTKARLRGQPGGTHNSSISGHTASSTSQSRLAISPESRFGMNGGLPSAAVRSIRRPAVLKRRSPPRDQLAPAKRGRQTKLRLQPGGRGWSCLFKLVMSWPRPVTLLERRQAPLPAGDPR
jgi:hypothetical protein